MICTDKNPSWKSGSTIVAQLCVHQKNKSLTPEEWKALNGLLYAVQPYCSELGVTLLFPKHRLPLPLDGDTPEERMEELVHKCSDIFEVVVASDYRPAPITLTRRFIRWFVQVFNTEFPPLLMRKVLERVMKKKYHY